MYQEAELHYIVLESEKTQQNDENALKKLGDKRHAVYNV